MARHDPQTAKQIGQRVRRFREERGLTLSALASTAELSKSYVSAIENGETPRPSGQTLYAIAEALGVTMSDLLGRRLLSEVETDRPPSLEEFAREHHLPEADVRMLASIRFRGGQPRTKQRWAHIYSAIRQTEWMDPGRSHSR
jgi:transcriptional regulator with XRE-family HTH domain